MLKLDAFIGIILQMEIDIENRGVYCKTCPIPKIAKSRLGKAEAINGQIQGNGRLSCIRVGGTIEGEIEAEFLSRKGHIENHRAETVIREVSLCHKIDRPVVTSKYIYNSLNKNA